MLSTATNPLFKISSIFLVALSLSMGWGMRGNFGHESGAWIPGALAAMAIAMLSGRNDWRRRVHFFALFGGLGLGFGGSISYMYTISFSASEHWPSAWYGFLTVFLVGGLWCGLGGGGTALAATASRDRLTALIVPMLFAIGALALHKLIEEPVAMLLSSQAAEAADERWFRHESPLYWFDADWFPALVAFLGVCVYDLVSRVRDRGFLLQLAFLLACVATGAVLGGVLQLGLRAVHLEERVADALVVPLADPTVVNPESGIAFGEELNSRTGEPYGTGNFLTNWPQFFGDYPQYVGVGLGLLLGWIAYFLCFGKWKNDSGLFLHMSLGWLIGFILMPVLGTAALYHLGHALGTETPLFGGFRLTPPRSDDWAGITGVFIGALIYCMRKGWGPVAIGASMSFVLGGIMFATMELLRSMLIVPGHPLRTPGGTPAEWAHYQAANWHSFLEQSQGFGHGLAIAISMAFLWSRIPERTDEPRFRRWTEPIAVVFVLFFMTYANIYKNVREWTLGQTKIVPETMKPPLIAELFTSPGDPIQFSALVWFNLAWIAVALAFLALIIVHMRGRRIAMLPDTWLGRGQLLYVMVLWMMVIGNFERALPNFLEVRLITEWVILVNAALATFLVGYLPRERTVVPAVEPPKFATLLGKVWAIGLPAGIVLMSLYTAITRGVYGDAPVFHPNSAHDRFGPHAQWRVKPMLKEGEHR